MKSTTQYVYCISSGLSWKSLAPWLPVSKIRNCFSTNYQAYVWIHSRTEDGDRNRGLLLAKCVRIRSLRCFESLTASTLAPRSLSKLVERLHRWILLLLLAFSINFHYCLHFETFCEALQSFRLNVVVTSPFLCLTLWSFLSGPHRRLVLKRVNGTEPPVPWSYAFQYLWKTLSVSAVWTICQRRGAVAVIVTEMFLYTPKCTWLHGSARACYLYITLVSSVNICLSVLIITLMYF